MSFSAKEAPEEMIGKRTPFSTAKSFASYCRSSAFDQSDGPMLALKFEELASALAAAYLDATVASASDPAPVGWRDIASAPKDGTLFLAATADGRVVIFRGDILATAMKKGTPNHLQFPAIAWMPLPVAPKNGRE